MKTILTLVMTGCLAIALAAAQSRSAADQYQEALRLEEVKGDLKGAIEQYKRLAESPDRAVAAKALVQMAGCYEKLGRSDGRIAYERVVSEFADQAEAAATARTRLATATPGDGHLQLAWFDRTGKLIERVGAPGGYRGPELSPDGRRLAIRDQDLNSGEIVIFDLVRSTRSRLLRDADRNERNSMPIWSPDGSRIVFGSFRSGKYGLSMKRTDNTGTDELLIESGSPTTPMSWSPDGKFLVYTVRDTTIATLWALPMTGDRTPVRVLAEPVDGSPPTWGSHGQVSPDGKWIAYQTINRMAAGGRLGRFEVHVKPFPAGSGSWQVSTASGMFPRWRGDGKELFFMDRETSGKIMAVDIRVTGSSIQPGVPRALFDAGFDNAASGGGLGPFHTYAVSADGQRFLIPRPAQAPFSR
jgi:dipeptidyl aminopeptidase/acylaminoacyl peptidase